MVVTRRAFLIAPFAVLGASRIAGAQPARQYRVGILGERSSDLSEARLWQGFRAVLRNRGWIESETISIVSRWAEGNPARLPELAADLVRLKVDVIVTRGRTGTGTKKIRFRLPASE